MRKVEYSASRILYRDEGGQLSRKDGPSSIFFLGSILWKQDGHYYRPDGGPTFINDDGSMVWHGQNNTPYRMVYSDGSCYDQTAGGWIKSTG
jgi:hypothetical protein